MACDASSAETPASVSNSVVPWSRKIPCTLENVSSRQSNSGCLKRSTGSCADILVSITYFLFSYPSASALICGINVVDERTRNGAHTLPDHSASRQSRQG